MRFSPFIIDLLREKSGYEIRLSHDCDLLTLDIESMTGEHIGVNTMKRLLGFIADERTPRTSTLNIIARYLGYADWESLRLEDAAHSNSVFDNRDELLACSMARGQKLLISENSNLCQDDLLTLTHIVRHYPLLVSDVIREGKSLGAFTAGKAQGIDFKPL